MNVLLPLLTLVLAPADKPPTVIPVDGSPFPAALAAVDASWKITFSSGDQRRTVPADDLVAWGACKEPGQETLLVLADGGLVAADVLEADKEHVAADSFLFGRIKLPAERLAGIVFQPPVEPQARDVLLDQVTSAQGGTDRVILVNGDRITGRLETIGAKTLRVETAVGPVDVAIDRVRAAVFNPALQRRSSPVGLSAVAGFRDGSRLVAQRLTVDRATLELTTPDGTAWKTAAEELVFLQPAGGRAEYLSDRKAAAYRHVPYLTLAWPYHTDRNVAGSMLRAGGRLYLKGLGMHSASRLTYALPAQESFRRFQAELAVDDATERRGSVRFRVFVDGREKYASPIVRGGEPPTPVSVDLAGAKRLDLIVDYADHADEQDHANWLWARLIR